MKLLSELLLPYQKSWLEDKSKLKIFLAARQCGKSMYLAGQACLWSLEKNNSLTTIVSTGERASQEFLRKGKQWAETVKILTNNELDYSENASTIKFSNNSRILSLPSNPRALRGFTGNLILDEFALCENDKEIFAAIAPSITNELTGKDDKHICIASTPFGMNNMFSKIWHSNNANWSKHSLNIYEAKSQGLPVDIENLKKMIDDEMIWSQEYECKFMSSASCPFETSKIMNSDIDYRKLPGNYFLGMDIGMSHDFSVISILKQLPNNEILICKVAKLIGMSEDEQFEELSKIYSEFSCPNGYIDCTGFGKLFSERCCLKMGNLKGYNFSRNSKNILFDTLRSAVNDSHLKIYSKINDYMKIEDIIYDFASMSRIIDGTSYSYVGMHNSNGHNDICTSIALGMRSLSENQFSLNNSNDIFFSAFRQSKLDNSFNRISRL